MGSTIDHLEAYQEVLVIRDFSDAKGVRHRAGERGWISRIALDWPGQRVVIEWERDGEPETMTFALAAGEGPGNGRMRDYFEVTGYTVPGVPGRTPSSEAPAAHQEPTREVIIPARDAEWPEAGSEPLVALTEGHHCAALQQAVALAKGHRFAEAEDRLRAVTRASTYEAARTLGAAAEQHAFTGDDAVYAWLRDRTIDCWYAWGSEATSGGDGAARLLEIKQAVARLQRLDREREGRPGGGASA